MMELEEASNKYGKELPKMCAEAKVLIVESMLSQNQQDIAVSYLKKHLITFGACKDFEHTIVEKLRDLQ